MSEHQIPWWQSKTHIHTENKSRYKSCDLCKNFFKGAYRTIGSSQERIYNLPFEIMDSWQFRMSWWYKIVQRDCFKMDETQQQQQKQRLAIIPNINIIECSEEKYIQDSNTKNLDTMGILINIYSFEPVR